MAPKKSRKLSELKPGTKDCGGMPPMKRAKTKAKATPPSVADGQSTFVVDDRGQALCAHLADVLQPYPPSIAQPSSSPAPSVQIPSSVTRAASVSPPRPAAPSGERCLREVESNCSAYSSTPLASGGLVECKSHYDIQNLAQHVAATLSGMQVPGPDGSPTSPTSMLSDAMDDVTWSGAFSGIETYAISDRRMEIAFSRRLRRKLQPHVKGRHLWCVEWNEQARSELLHHPALGDECCIFGDIKDFVRPEFKNVVDHVFKHPHLHHVLKPAVLSGKLVGAQPKAFCYRHNQVCLARRTRGHRAGTPCTDFSKRGSQLGLQGPTVVYLLVWMTMMVSLQPDVIGQENVREFPADVLAEYLGHIYSLQWATENSINFAFPVNRFRQLCILNHKERTMPYSDLIAWDAFLRDFYRTRSIDCNHKLFFEATQEDLLIMHNDLTNKGKGKTKKASMRTTVVDLDNFDWAGTLPPGQIRHLKAYRKVAAGEAFALSQDVDTGFGSHSSDGVLHTIIRNCRPTWLDWLSRPATGSELLFTQGVLLPQHMENKITGGVAVSPFNIESEDRTETSRGNQAGNGMNIQVAALMTQYMLLNLVLKDSPTFKGESL